MDGSVCVRKGAWSEVEDDLLRACVRQYGEGKWHLVPTRAGLNRCRKSCRLRWLNYLKPNIKRGEFSEDEVDMMQRLHKLLGNRWSLIAGRLPGRTPNDVKNYWNTFIRRKLSSSSSSQKVVVMMNEKEEERVRPHVVIKPKARTISSSRPSPWLRGSVLLREGDHESTHHGAKHSLTQPSHAPSSDQCSDNWWETIVYHNGGNINENNDQCLLGYQDDVENLVKDINFDHHNLASFTTHGRDFLIEGETWSDFLLDTNLWGL